jgi:hypothetical protein
MSQRSGMFRATSLSPPGETVMDARPRAVLGFGRDFEGLAAERGGDQGSEKKPPQQAAAG